MYEHETAHILAKAREEVIHLLAENGRFFYTEHPAILEVRSRVIITLHPWTGAEVVRDGSITVQQYEYALREPVTDYLTAVAQKRKETPSSHNT